MKRTGSKHEQAREKPKKRMGGVTAPPAILQVAPNTQSIAIDWDYCFRLLEASSASDDDKCALIECLISIAGTFADLGFGFHPLQQTDGKCLVYGFDANGDWSACEQYEELSRAIGEFVLNSNDTPKPSPLAVRASSSAVKRIAKTAFDEAASGSGGGGKEAKHER